ncbi:heavy metal translocating P-type ATPase [Haploplasma modicum]|uniref:heavy metal translocating P-type ATPase n=1 Tax=Haploplasma modicum TaxID=2150 RepID=UPI00214CF874|nr:heavy metal translocating P-type ATPase [Haploplasma modicum]MCR1809460.1 heavy metal translocating P-type ATPase [Haploplasma modicum]
MNNNSNNNEKKTYYVEGFSCASCANTFEKNVKSLKNVKDANVNFGASKITVSGNVSIEELEKAGSFENLIIREDRHRDINKNVKESFISKYQLNIIGVILLGLGLLSNYLNSETNLITILIFVFSMIISGYNLFVSGIKNLLKFNFDMKTLMTIAVIGGAIIGQWSEVAIVVILFSLSEELEKFTMDKARKSIKMLVDIAPKEAMVRRDGFEKTVNVNDIIIGDIMIVRPGDKIAMDGIIISGSTSVNQAAITGESMPLGVSINDNVYAGTLNQEGLIEVEITKLVTDTTIAKIIHLVEEAQGERAPAQAFVDKFAKYYTPIIMIVALLVILLPPLFFKGEWSHWIYQGLAVLVVGCPCALVISTPISIVSAIGNAAKEGVLVKGGIYLEQMGKAKAIAFDKTGTLTEGNPTVTDIMIYNKEISKERLMILACALEKNSTHPLANAIIEYGANNAIDFKDIEVDNFKAIVGKGLTGQINNETYYIGNLSLFVDELNIFISNDIRGSIEILHHQAKTIMIIGTQSEVFGCLAVADQVREESKSVISRLKKLGIKDVIMLTGDNDVTANSISKELNLDTVKANLMPEDKLQAINELKDKYTNVIMIGDGVNDAPALAAATVGIAMGTTGTDTALETADVALMGDDLEKLPFIIKLSRKTLRIIKSNITFAIGIKIIALLLVIPGWLTLWIAIASDMGATLLVALNSMRLMRKDKNK